MLELVRQQEELRGATFNPLINVSQYHLSNFKPIHERYREVQIFKEKMLLQMKQQFEQSQDLTFKPKLHLETERLALLRNQGSGVLDRIQNEADEIIIKKMRLVKKEDQKLAEICTFKPEINTLANEEVVYGYIDTP